MEPTLDEALAALLEGRRISPLQLKDTEPRPPVPRRGRRLMGQTMARRKPNSKKPKKQCSKEIGANTARPWMRSRRFWPARPTEGKAGKGRPTTMKQPPRSCRDYAGYCGNSQSLTVSSERIEGTRWLCMACSTVQLCPIMNWNRRRRGNLVILFRVYGSSQASGQLGGLRN